MNNMTDFGYLTTGTIVSCLNISVLHPFFTLKTQLMNREKVSKLYHGFRANLLCDISNQVVNFYVFGCLKNRAMMYTRRDLTDAECALLGIFSGSSSGAGLSLTERLMIIQMDRAKPTDSMLGGSNTMRSIVREVVATEGIRGVLNGMIPTMIRESVNSACFFGLSKHFRPKLQRVLVGDVQENTLAQEIKVVSSSYLLAGMISGAVTTPVDTVKTRMQRVVAPHGAPEKKSGIQLAKELWRELRIDQLARRDFFKATLARSLTIGLSQGLIMGPVADLLLPKVMPSFFFKPESERIN